MCADLVGWAVLAVMVNACIFGYWLGGLVAVGWVLQASGLGFVVYLGWVVYRDVYPIVKHEVKRSYQWRTMRRRR